MIGNDIVKHIAEWYKNSECDKKSEVSLYLHQVYNSF